jgi:soluble lytic murein transglycosylase
MLNRFSGNFALAAAAYNAGPHRVNRWLPDSQTLPADIWIEMIPFDETRNYVVAVLTNALIYQHRLKRNGLKITDLLKDISPKKT